MRANRNISGARIKQARELLDITQEQLAARLAREAHESGLASGWVPSRQMVERMEAGDKIVTDIYLYLLARVLQADPGWLIGWPDSRPPKPEKT